MILRYINLILALTLALTFSAQQHTQLLVVADLLSLQDRWHYHGNINAIYRVKNKTFVKLKNMSVQCRHIVRLSSWPLELKTSRRTDDKTSSLAYLVGRTTKRSTLNLYKQTEAEQWAWLWKVGLQIRTKNDECETYESKVSLVWNWL